MVKITIFVDVEKLADVIITDIRKELASLKSHRKPN